MSAFREALDNIIGGDVRKPPRCLPLPPSIFSSEWSGAPKETVTVGLRLLADGDEQTARAEAEKFALQLHGDDPIAYGEAFNDALLRWVVARGICHPENVEMPTDILPMAEDQVRFALTKAGVRYIFDAIEALQIETSPIFGEADPEEIAELARRLQDDPGLEVLGYASGGRARRLLQFVLNELRATDPLD